MFTGIIETLGEIVEIKEEAENLTFWVKSTLAESLKIDQSLAHNGVCLTVTQIRQDVYSVTAIHETLVKSNIGKLQIGSLVNLERCMPATGRFDGHFVQGHVDQIGICNFVVSENGSWRFGFEYDPSQGNFTVEKGSICVNGVSLTVVNSQKNSFEVAIIPYTFENTNFQQIQKGDSVNLEFDVLGKYIKKILENSAKN